MGNVLSPASGLVQVWHYGSRAEKLSRRAYELDSQDLRLGVLSTIREEVRDQVFVIMSGLDNLMVVSTLMLSIGFGFVVEGTFPPRSAQMLGNWKIAAIGFSVDPLVVYAFLCAMSLVCPFWCLIFTIRMRYEVDLIVGENMKELKRQLCNVLQKKEMQAPSPEPKRTVEQRDERMVRPPEVSMPLLDQPANLVQSLGSSWTRPLRRVLAACPARWQDEVEQAATSMSTSIAQVIGPFTISDEIRYIDQQQILKWANQDLLQRMNTYHFYTQAAHFLLWAGMLFAIMTCAILLGLYMMESFPNTPTVWRTYSTITGVNAGFAVIFAIWMWLSWHGNSEVAVAGSTNGTMGFHSNRPGSGIVSLDEASPLQGNRQAIFRIRDASSGLNAYRQISFPLDPSGCRKRAAPIADLTGLHSRICAKFQKQSNCRGPQKFLHLKTLVRTCDRLEIVDDEDVAQLADGDELEAVFGAGALQGS